MNTSYFLEHAELSAHPALFSDACIDRTERLKGRYREQETHQVIYETVLTEPEDRCDISFRVDTGKKPVANYWLEFDYAVYASEGGGALVPCTFLDASCLKPNGDPENIKTFLEQGFAELVGKDKAARLEQTSTTIVPCDCHAVTWNDCRRRLFHRSSAYESRWDACFRIRASLFWCCRDSNLRPRRQRQAHRRSA